MEHPRFHVCWLAADEVDGAAIRIAATAGETGERRLSDWPHLVLRGVDGQDVNKLERLVRPKRKGERLPVGGKLLVRGKMTEEPFTCVSLVEASFLQALDNLTDQQLTEHADAWAQKIEGVTSEAARQLLGQMAAFARQAREAAKPVLQLDVL